MRPRASTRIERVKKLTSAGIWAAVMVTWVLAFIAPGWTLVAGACTLAVTALSLIARLAAFDALPFGRRWGRRPKGSSLRGDGRDGDDGPAGGAAHQWHTLVMVSRLMPRSANRRWLAEAESLLAEVPAARRGAAVRSYQLSAPRLMVMMWVREALRRLQPGPRRPG
jgi:hypothetical protein